MKLKTFQNMQILVIVTTGFEADMLAFFYTKNIFGLFQTDRSK
jgi:hypothetical protein